MKRNKLLRKMHSMQTLTSNVDAYASDVVFSMCQEGNTCFVYSIDTAYIVCKVIY